MARRAEQFGIGIAELAGELPGQVHRLLEVIGDGQFEIHLRTDELQPLVRRIERLGKLWKMLTNDNGQLLRRGARRQYGVDDSCGYGGERHRSASTLVRQKSQLGNG